jgi:hypothetical protein
VIPLILSATLHPILHSRIGPDQFVSRMARLREDPRFRAVQPDAFDTDGGAADHPVAVPVRDVQEGAEGGEMGVEEDEGLELWFDWAFVDFWKNHYCELWLDLVLAILVFGRERDVDARCALWLIRRYYSEEYRH